MSDCCPIEVIELQPLQTIEIDIETAQEIQVIEIGEAGPAGPTIWSAIAEKPDVFPPAPHDHAGQYDPAGAAETARQQAIAAAADDATAKADAAQQAAAADATAKANAAQTAAALDATQKIDALKDGVNTDGDTLAKLRALIANLQTLLTSDNVNLDTLQEVVDFVETHQSSLESLGASKVNVSDIINALNDTSSNKPLAAAQGKVLKDLLDALTIVVDGKQPLIVAGSTGQYWRGDKTWRDFATDVRAAALTGLSTATNAVILATDSVLTAFGKLQAQIAAVAANAIAHIARTDNPHEVTAAQAGAEPAGAAASAISAHVAAPDSHTQYALKSALGDAASKDVGTNAGTVCAGDDSRLSDAREWTASTVDQPEAEAGTSTTRRAWTSERVWQAIAAWWLTASSAFGRTLANVADAAAGRTELGLGNVDNTSDADKPVSTDQQTALDLKADKAITISAGTGLNGGGDLSANRTLAVTYGTTAGTAAQGNDSRLSDAREWTASTVSQAEAEAGTATTRRAWTAERVRQAIAAWWLTASSAFGRTLANAADAAAGRTALGLGTAAVADVTTSATDTTAGRVTKVGDFGWGGEPETLSGSWNDLGGQSRLVKGALNSMTDGPTTGAMWLFGQYVRLASGNGYFFGHILSITNPRTFLRFLSGGVWQTWIEIAAQARDATFAALTATGNTNLNGATGIGTSNTSIAKLTVSGGTTGAGTALALWNDDTGGLRALKFTAYSGTASGDTWAINAGSSVGKIKLQVGSTDGFVLDSSRNWLPGADNTQNVGASDKRIKDIYLANAPTVSSDQALKTTRRDFLDAELDAIDACELGLFQWLDAVADKGDAARLHAGVIAQQVITAFESRGLDPYHYGPICRDPIFEERLIEERPVTRQRQVTRTVPSEDRRIEIIDGVPTEIVEIKQVEEPVFEMRPVVRQDGTPVMETVQVLQDDGTPLLDEAGQPVTAERPVLHQCPAMEDYEDIERVTEQVQTGWRYSIRYDELLIMFVAACRRKNARLAERIAALESAQ